MLTNIFKESRMASIEVLFEFFKAVPKDYYSSIEKQVNGLVITTRKTKNLTIEKKLDLKKNGFDYVKISGIYLNAQDQRIFRAILESLYKEEERKYSSQNIQSLSSCEDYIQKDTTDLLYSNYKKMKVTDFYKILNPKSKKSVSESFEKMHNSIERLSHTVLSFYTEDKINSIPEKILTAPLLIYERDKEYISFQLHPCLMSYKFESKNKSSIIKLEQHFYSLDNINFLNKKMSELEQLIYSKIQYKFASMNKKHNSFSFDLEDLYQSIYIESEEKCVIQNRKTKLKNAIKGLDSKFEYNLTIKGMKPNINVFISRP